MPYNATTSDIEAVWRPLSDDEASVAFNLLLAAERLINAVRPALPLAVTVGQVSEAVVIDVMVEMVQRVLRNPDRLAAQNITADGGVGVNFGGTDSGQAKGAPRLELLPQELALLDAAIIAGTGVGRVRSRRMLNYGAPTTGDVTLLPGAHQPWAI